MTLIDLYRLAAEEQGVPTGRLGPEIRAQLKSRAMPLMWPGFEVVSGGERPLEVISLSEYDPGWRLTFESWRTSIHREMGASARRVDHVGSTAVQGLVAKPVVDIQVSVSDLENEELYRTGLERLGLRMSSRDDAHRYFRPEAGSARTVHVHVCRAGSTWERVHLLFRDFLRGDEDARTAYVAAKRSAASTWADDRWAYTEAKTEVILSLLERAAVWALRVSWHPVPEPPHASPR